MALMLCTNLCINSGIPCTRSAISFLGIRDQLPTSLQRSARAVGNLNRERVSQIIFTKEIPFLRKASNCMMQKNVIFTIPRSSNSSNVSGEKDKSSDEGKTPFGYTRKDVLLIGLGFTIFGIGLKSGLEFVGVDPLQAGNVVQLVLVLGLTVGWISTYIFRVSNKEMTYAQQLRDYESKVMQKRLEGLTEAELEVLLEQVEEEKRSLASGSGEQVN